MNTVKDTFRKRGGGGVQQAGCLRRVMITKVIVECLPAGHSVVSVEHLLSQLAVLDPARELNVSELISQELRPQKALHTHTHTCFSKRHKHELRWLRRPPPTHSVTHI